MKCKYIQCNGIMQQVMYKEVQPLLKLQLKLSEASDRLAVSKVMPHSAQICHRSRIPKTFPQCRNTFFTVPRRF